MTFSIIRDGLADGLVEIARNTGSKGLEFVELLHDDGPVIPIYLAVEPDELSEYSIRRQLEYVLLFGRCSL